MTMLGTLTVSSKHAVNRLINGGFYRVLTPIVDDSVTVVPAAPLPLNPVTYPFKKFAFEDGVSLAPTLGVGEDRPKETLLAGWYVYGVEGQVAVRPLDENLQVPIRGLHGPTPARFTLNNPGTMIVEQVLDDPKFWALLDRDLTLSFAFQRNNLSLNLELEIDYGVSVETLLAVNSSVYPEMELLVARFKPPMDATQFILRWKLIGEADSSVYIGEAMLQFGHVIRPKFTDDISILGRPRGMVFFYRGEESPPGYVVDCEVEGRFAFPTGGDAATSGAGETRFGGSTTHNHGGRTSNRVGTTGVSRESSGGSRVNRYHRHEIGPAEIDPPWHKVLLLQKV